MIYVKIKIIRTVTRGAYNVLSVQVNWKYYFKFRSLDSSN